MKTLVMPAKAGIWTTYRRRRDKNLVAADVALGLDTRLRGYDGMGGYHVI